MERLRILIVCKYFYPERNPRAFRATELAKEFSRMGHEVVVAFPSNGIDYNVFEIEHRLKIMNLGNISNGVLLRGRRISYWFRRALRRFLSFIEYPDIQLMFLVKNFLKSNRGFDLLISIAVPHPIHWGVARAWGDKQHPAKIWVADCGDPFMFLRLDTFRKPFFFIPFEKSFCKQCNYISVPFEEMRNQFYPEFRDKIVVIPQGFNLMEVRRFEGSITNSCPTFIYAGSIIPGKRDLTLLLDFLSAYNDDFKFIIYTNRDSWYQKYKVLLTHRLDIRRYIDREDLIFEMSKANFLVNIDSILDDDSNVEAVPSKLIDYALAGRPILNLKSNYLDEDKVIAFFSGNYSGARQIDIRKFDIKAVANKFIKIGQKT